MAAERPRLVARRTVRFRVTALATLVTALVLGVTAVVLVTVQRRALTSSLDETLAAEAAALADDADRTSLSPPPIDDDAVAQVVVADEVVEASGAPIAERPLVDAAEIRAAVDDGPAVRTVGAVPGGEGEFRVALHPVDGGAGEPATVALVGAPLDDIAESTGLLATSLAVAVPTVTALLAVLVWRLVGRTLRPVEAIRREVAHISGADLRRRVPEPAGGDEVARLARTMNAMLGRLDEAAERQRRFVGDASHELRTPLARIRSDIEVDLAHPAAADAAATERRVLDEAIGMQHLVEDLLHLARADAGAGGARPSDGDRATTERRDLAVDELVAAEVDRARQRSTVDVALRTDGRPRVRGDGAELRRAVANLLDNAGRYARTRVEVTVSVENGADGVDDPPEGVIVGAAVVRVTDDGPGVPPADAERIFERFTRLDDARARTDGGTGLGLAIARTIAEDHGGDLALDPTHRDGARFVLRLPLTTPDRRGLRGGRGARGR